MRIEILREIDFEQLTAMLRQVPLMQPASDGFPIRVYEKAEIGIRILSPDEVNPSTFYLIASNLQFQRKLRENLLTKGIDTLNLEKALEIQNGEEIWTLTPPIIEVTPRTVQYIPQDGEINYSKTTELQIPTINDGCHRIKLAQDLGINVTCVFISGASREYPFYAHPNSWDEVKIVSQVPETKREKKLYMREDCYALYRNFGAIGCDKPRFTSK